VPATPFSRADGSAFRLQVWSVGDSLSDSGNIPAPSPPYFAGRWSNGPTYADRLAFLLGIGGGLVPSNAGGTNYARSGARIIGTNGVAEQVVSYLQDARWRADRRAVYVVFIGGNDLRDGLLAAFADPAFDPAAFVDRRLAALGLTLTGLSTFGARNIVVLGLPDLSGLPGLPPQAVPLAAFMSARFNAGVQRIVRFLDRGPGRAAFVNVSTFFQGIVADALAGGPQFGITNVTGTCLTIVNGMPVAQCANPDQYLFWDPLHPTGRIHDLLAQFVLESLAD
jgi:outer membrane lipase/esterase